MSAHPRVSFVRLMECNCGVWEAQPQALCISELRNFVLYFTEGYYKTALRRWTYLMWCTLQATPRWLGAVQSVVVPSGHGLEAAGGSVVLWGHRVAVNMTWAFFYGNIRKSAHGPPSLMDLKDAPPKGALSRDYGTLLCMLPGLCSAEL